MQNTDRVVLTTLPELEPEKEKASKKYNVIACNNCHKTNVTLIKATDSYYCKACFLQLGKQKYVKKKGR